MPQVDGAQAPSRGTITVVGAGIVGMSAAHFLVRAGWTVTVLDACVPAAGATGASDGAVSVASKRAGPLMTMAVAGVRFYHELTAAGVLTDEFAPRPTFIVATDIEELPVLERHAAQLQAEGVAVRMLQDAHLAQSLGSVAPGAIAAAEVQGDGHALGYRVVERLRRLGGFSIRRNVRAVSLHRAAGRIDGVVTERGIERADAVLLAAGIGSIELLAASAIMRPRKGQLIVTDRGAGDVPPFPGPLMSCRYLLSKGSQPAAGEAEDRSFGLVIDPLANGQFLIGGTREDSADAASTDADAVAHLLRLAVELSPALAQLRVLRVFAGIRTATRDGLPIVGPLFGHDNVFIATGFEGDGICLGPLMGRVCQQLICGEATEIDVSPLRADRFGDVLVAA